MMKMPWILLLHAGFWRSGGKRLEKSYKVDDENMLEKTIEKGRVVRSLAGRDKNHFFAIFEFDDVYCFLVDGKMRKLEHPKKKKLRHVSVTKTVIDLDCFEGNKKLKAALEGFEKKK
ncbi:MAG: KOW domain-containing RNA-binding protein [Oscillospiraceae bacterium]|jgi:ribosomal protein L14E/L6E/L27E|nr:KOW domain-containing RNA-binding protein [Oscillospiraceae bacterium]